MLLFFVFGDKINELNHVIARCAIKTAAASYNILYKYFEYCLYHIANIKITFSLFLFLSQTRVTLI